MDKQLVQGGRSKEPFPSESRHMYSVPARSAPDEWACEVHAIIYFLVTAGIWRGCEVCGHGFWARKLLKHVHVGVWFFFKFFTFAGRTRSRWADGVFPQRKVYCPCVCLRASALWRKWGAHSYAWHTTLYTNEFISIFAHWMCSLFLHHDVSKVWLRQLNCKAFNQKL